MLDDVQWADRSSLRLLRHVLRDLRDERLLIVATHRTVGAEGSDGWQSLLPDLIREPVIEQIELRGLSPKDTLRCAAGVSDRPIPADLAARLHRLTGFLPASWGGRTPPRTGSTRRCPRLSSAWWEIASGGCPRRPQSS